MYPGRPAQQQSVRAGYAVAVCAPKGGQYGHRLHPAAPVSLLSFSKGGFAAFSLLARHHRVF